MSNQGFGRPNGGNQFNSRAYMASFSDSNRAYTSETCSIQRSHYGSFLKPSSSFDNFVA